MAAKTRPNDNPSQQALVNTGIYILVAGALAAGCVAGGAVNWQGIMVLPAADKLVLPGVGADNFFFAVATRDREGNESLPAVPTRVD